MNKQIKILILVNFLIIVIGGLYLLLFNNPKIKTVNYPVSNFEDCVASGNLVMESYPRQCHYDGETYREDIGNELEKIDLITLDSPRPNEKVSSPLEIRGQARGLWFFEADFPVFLEDANANVIAEGIATAQGDWMTNDFIPFIATLTFNTNVNSHGLKGKLILKKDNPSDLVEFDDALEIPLIIK